MREVGFHLGGAGADPADGRPCNWSILRGGGLRPQGMQLGDLSRVGHRGNISLDV